MEVTINKQLDLWKVGKSRHNIGGGCCPDFSCCFPQLKASESEKMLFCDAWVNRNELKNQMILQGMMLIFFSKLNIVSNSKLEITGFYNA